MSWFWHRGPFLLRHDRLAIGQALLNPERQRSRRHTSSSARLASAAAREALQPPGARLGR